VNINATLISQMITFGLFVWFTMTFVWPQIITALEERREKIADGLAAAERGQNELLLAQEKATAKLREVKQESATILDNANKRANSMIDDAKHKAREEGDRLLERAQSEIQSEAQAAKTALQSQVATLAVRGAEKILSTEVDAAKHKQLLDELIKEL